MMMMMMMEVVRAENGGIDRKDNHSNGLQRKKANKDKLFLFLLLN